MGLLAWTWLDFWSNTLQVFLLVLGFFLILVVLLQRGRGGGLAGAFGGAGGQSAFGTKAGDVFTRITIGIAVLWVITSGVNGMLIRHWQTHLASEFDSEGDNPSVVPGAGDDEDEGAGGDLESGFIPGHTDGFEGLMPDGGEAGDPDVDVDATNGTGPEDEIDAEGEVDPMTDGGAATDETDGEDESADSNDETAVPMDDADESTPMTEGAESGEADTDDATEPTTDGETPAEPTDSETQPEEGAADEAEADNPPN